MQNRTRLLIALGAVLLATIIIVVPPLLSYARTVLPAASAKITVTPVIKRFDATYTLTGVTGSPDAARQQVQVRSLSYTTPARSRQVNAKVSPDDDAHGTITIAGTSQDEVLPAGTVFTSNNGVEVKTSADVTVPAKGAVTASASAVDAGSRGNVAPYNLNTSYSWTHDQGTILSNPVGFFFCLFILIVPCLFVPDTVSYDRAHVFNATAFVGGKDPYVRQSDIDEVTTPFVAALTGMAQEKVSQQMRPGEQLVNAIACSAQINPPHTPNNHTASLRVSASVNCRGVVYDPPGIRLETQELLAQDAYTRLGALYQLENNISTTVKSVGMTGTTISFLMYAEGVWAYMLSSGQAQQMARLIAGKTQAESKTLLLQQPGVGKVGIQISGGAGEALPESPQDIEIVIQSPDTGI